MFKYEKQMVEVKILCKSSYLPMEARIDRISFELLLAKTKSKNIVLVNGQNQKVEQIRQFCQKSLQNTHV